MDYKEKYEMALEGIQEILGSGEDSIKMSRLQLRLQGIFPELNKSEDERIRKAIHIYLDWLDGRKDYAPRGEYTIRDMIAWVEKQGEQKPTIIIPKFRVGDEIKTSNEESLTITKIDEKGYWSEDLFICSFEDSAKWDLVGKLVDKVEPKFHEGDWIIHQGTENIYQVVAIIDNQYQLKYGDNYTVQKCADVDRSARLWTIADAKDGDVLFTSSTASHETFIFKSIDEKGNAECYFAYDSEDGFREGKYHFIGRATNCKPATKEQRDTLIKAMADAGYEWDAEKKELKKIEQKPAWSEEDNEIIEELNSYVKNLDLLFESIKIGDTDILAREFREKVQSWLKSIKDKYVPQPKQEWSEEDETIIDNLVWAIANDRIRPQDRDDYCAWLKSLRPQKHWKPSDEQMKALESVIAMPPDGFGWESTLESLYNDLKKLKG